jgi:hypothetical protein
MSAVKKIATNLLRSVKESCLSATSRDLNEKLAARDAQRGRGGLRWFTPEEAAIVEALTNIIVPSDEETPGLEDVGVFGPPAVVALDNLVVASSYRQFIYARGLLSFDAWAFKKRKTGFAKLSKEDQIALLRDAQEVFEKWTAPSTLQRVSTKVRAITQSGVGPYFASQFYPVIRDDCFVVFYTNRVSWSWLEYDGPPMDLGYISVTEPREGTP